MEIGESHATIAPYWCWWSFIDPCQITLRWRGGQLWKSVELQLLWFMQCGPLSPGGAERGLIMEYIMAHHPPQLPAPWYQPSDQLNGRGHGGGFNAVNAACIQVCLGLNFMKIKSKKYKLFSTECLSMVWWWMQNFVYFRFWLFGK